MALRRSAAAIGALLLLAAAAPVVSGRMAAQETNAYWRDRATAFVDAFALDGAGDGDAALLRDPQSERLWRMARNFGAPAGLSSLERDRDAIGIYQTFAVAHFDQAQRQAQELRCLAEAIYYEARSESRAGQAAVAEVVLNRARHSAYPDSICGVVYDGVAAGRTAGCQFSFACDGSMRRAPRGRAWDNAEKLAALEMLSIDGGRSSIGGATHYHTVAVQPRWSGELVRVTQIGSHIFYRFRGRNDPRTTPATAPLTAVSATSDQALPAIIAPIPAPSGVAPAAQPASAVDDTPA